MPTAAANQTELEEQIKFLRSLNSPMPSMLQELSASQTDYTTMKLLKHELSRLLERCTLNASKTKATQVRIK